MKKVKLLLTMAVIVFATMICCSMSAFALTDGDWEFQLLDNEVEITGYLGEGGDVVIPETIYGVPVTRVHTAKYGKNLDNATSIKFPSGVKVIEKVTYSGGDCKIKKVTLSEGVEKIEQSAFSGCGALESINLPSTLKSIGIMAFSNCYALDNIVFPDGLTEIENSSFSYTGLEEVDLSNTKAKVGESVFADCKNLKKVRLPQNLTEISGGMFEGCISLVDIEIPAGVETIGTYTFNHCESLESIILPVSLKRLDSHAAFSYCNNLKEIVIPYGTEWLGGRSFEGCTNLKAVYIPDTVSYISPTVIDDCPNAIVYCTSDSFAAKHCKNEKISYLTDNSVNSGITVLYNGTRISFHSYGQNPELLNSRTLVPLRSIFEAMGASVEWDGATSTAIAKRGNVEVKITIGANEIYKNGKAIPVDVPAMLLNSRTMVPARVIAEAFGADVDWNGNGRVVLITE